MNSQGRLVSVRAERESMSVSQSDPCACHLLEEERAEARSHRFPVDPYDVLNGPALTCCRSPYEWGDASMINPLPRPER